MAYKNAVVTFLDILGFRQIASAPDSWSRIDAMLNALAETNEPVGSDEGTDVLSFSDSVVRVRPTSVGLPFDALLHEVQDLAAAQWSLLEHGILVRGGTTIGDVATSPGRAFGPAFIRAYELESSVAGAPRIVLDPAVIESLRRHVAGARSTSERRRMIDELRGHVRLGGDGLWFVDYIAGVSKTIDDKVYIQQALGRFKDIIIREALRWPADSSVLPKYLWLIKYHNSSAKKLFPKSRKLKITRMDVPSSDEFLRPIPRAEN